MVDYHVSTSTSSGVGRDCEIAGELQHFCSRGYFIRAIHIQADMNIMFCVQEINTPVHLKKRSHVLEHGKYATPVYTLSNYQAGHISQGNRCYGHSHTLYKSLTSI